MRRQIITFAGNKEQLHKNRKLRGVEADKSMNRTIIELIENHLNSADGAVVSHKTNALSKK